MKFLLPYTTWINSEEHGFYINNAWDFATNKEIGVGRMQLTEEQRTILGYITQQDEDGKFPYETCILSKPKKGGKTTEVASIIAWFIECAPPYTEAIICANSLEQSERLIYNDVSFHFSYTKRAKVYKDKIEAENGSKIYILSKNYTSAAGSRHALVVFDELWGATSEDDRRRYDELTPIPTITHSLRLISSYAGFYGESNLLYDLYLSGVDEEENPDGKGTRINELAPLPCYKNGSQFTLWSHEGTMPWQTDAYYDSQRLSLRPNAFLRLHENRWVTSREVFIPIEWWEAAEKHLQQSAEIWEGHPYAKSPLYIAIDAASKRDCTAVIAVAPDTKLGKIALVFHKLWTPVEGEILNLEETLEPYILSMSKRFRIKDISCDPSHMYQIIVRLRNKGLPVNEFSQTDSGMTQASQHLFDLLRQDNILAYPSPDIKEHLQNVMAEYTSRGVRIVKDKSNSRLASKKIDAAVALAIACHQAYVDVGRVQAAPVVIESNLGERMRAWGDVSKEPSWLPEPFRSND